jgi:hypothetical protein
MMYYQRLLRLFVGWNLGFLDCECLSLDQPSTGMVARKGTSCNLDLLGSQVCENDSMWLVGGGSYCSFRITVNR